MKNAWFLLFASTACAASRCGSADGRAGQPPPRAIQPAGAQRDEPAALPESDARPDPRCLEITFEANSEETNRLFTARELQSGGETWRPILEAFAHRHGTRIEELDQPPPGYPGFGAPFAIATPRGPGWFTLDSEGDAAVFCASDATLLNDVRADYQEANRDRKKLARVLGEAAGFGLE